MKILWLLLAYAGSVAGFGWLALANETHWHQVTGGSPAGTPRFLRCLGVLALLLSLVACLCADHPTMAALVWVMTLTASALTVTFMLSWRPRLLLPLTFWLAATTPKAASTSNSIAES